MFAAWCSKQFRSCEMLSAILLDCTRCALSSSWLETHADQRSKLWRTLDGGRSHACTYISGIKRNIRASISLIIELCFGWDTKSQRLCGGHERTDVDTSICTSTSMRSLLGISRPHLGGYDQLATKLGAPLRLHFGQMCHKTVKASHWLAGCNFPQSVGNLFMERIKRNAKK